jgi:hypothetical protein
MHCRFFYQSLTIIAIVLAFFSQPAAAAESMITCTMKYHLKGWSFAYSQYKGTGDISCNNGQSAHVILDSKAVGFTIGISEIDGTGKFTELKDINEIYGFFASLEGHAGVTKSGSGQVLTRGIISLALSGEGRGFDIGVTLGGLRIIRAGASGSE